MAGSRQPNSETETSSQVMTFADARSSLWFSEECGEVFTSAPVDRFDAWTAGMEACCLLVEAQSVIIMRLLGFVGARPSEPDEALRMVVEKPAAFVEAGGAAWQAAAQAGRADHAVAAAIRSLRDKTGANVRRLSETEGDVASTSDDPPGSALAVPRLSSDPA
ncbi:MAG: hypothetical protein AAFU80_03225 [Pseudomonadota bacterium]